MAQVAKLRAQSEGGGRTIDPRRYVYFERIAFMNEQGSRPVIVLNPIHPHVVRRAARTWVSGAEGRAGVPACGLHERLDFVVVDADIRRWGGSLTDWSNATHVNRRNMRLLLGYVVAHSQGAGLSHAVQQLRLPVRFPALRAARLVGLRRNSFRLAFLTAAWVVLRLVGLALPAAHALDDRGRLRGGAADRADDKRRRRLYLFSSLTINLGLLGYFKYADFFLGSLDGIGQALGLPVDLPALNILLPIGISFYTFNSISYTIDVYRRAGDADEASARVHDLRRALPTPGRRPDRPLRRHRAAAEASDTLPSPRRPPRPGSSSSPAAW